MHTQNGLDINSFLRRTYLGLFEIILMTSLAFQVQVSTGQGVEVQNIRKDSERCDSLLGLAYKYIEIDDSLALQYASFAFKMASRLGDSLRIVKAGRIKTSALRRLSEIDSTITVSLEILKIARRNGYVTESKHILNRIGAAYILKAEYDKALEYLFESLKIRLVQGDKIEIGVTMNNIGLVYFKLEDYDKALAYYSQCLNIKNETCDVSELDLLLINIALCHIYNKNFRKANEFIDWVDFLCDNRCSKLSDLEVSFCRGLIQFETGNLHDAESQFLKSYYLSKDLRNQRFQFDNIIYLSRLYIQRNELNLARHYLEEAEHLVASGTPFNLELIKIYKEFTNLYDRMGKFKLLAHYQSKYIRIKDAIYNEDLTRNLMRLESEYQERENISKIQSQAKILELNQGLIMRQKILNLSTGLIVFLLAFLAFILIRNNKQRRRANILLEQRVNERTAELAQNNDTLLRIVEEQTVVFQKVSADVRSSIATIKGLCSLGLSDSETSYGGQYMQKIVATSDQLLGNVSRTLTLKSTK